MGLAFLSQCRSLEATYQSTSIKPQRWQWSSQRDHLCRVIDGSPQRSVGGGFAGQKTPRLCPHLKRSHQLTDIQPPSTAECLTLSLRGYEISSSHPSKDAIETKWQPKREKPFWLIVKAPKHSPNTGNSLPTSAVEDSNSLQSHSSGQLDPPRSPPFH